MAQAAATLALLRPVGVGGRVLQGSTRQRGAPGLHPWCRPLHRDASVKADDGKGDNTGAGSKWRLGRRHSEDDEAGRWGTSVPPARRRGLINFGPENWDRLWGEISYQYYNWRQDTTNDLVLFVAFFAFLILSGTLIKPLLLEGAGVRDPDGFWTNLYEILALSLSQDLPPASPTQFSAQLFSVGVAAGGLSAFALVLALVEQVVFEVFEENVRRGSEVYEDGHVLVLSWCAGQRDFEVLTKVLFQLCQAYRSDGGTVVVVLSTRPKLDMEATFRRSLPVAERHGTRFVFRSGSPLVPDDLRAVSANTASTTVIIADQSRPPDEADAQSIRCAILLDELEPPRPPPSSSSGGGGDGGARVASGVMHAMGLGLWGVSRAGGVGTTVGAAGSGGAGAAPRPRSPIVVELLTGNAMAMLYYSCSNRVVAVPTAQLNARRITKLLQHPVISTISQQIMSFETPASCLYVQSFPELTGLEFNEITFRFDSAIVLGAVNRITRKAVFGVSPSHKLMPDEDVILLRPTDVSFPGFRPLPQALPGTPPVEEAQSWAIANNSCRWVPRGATPPTAAAAAAAETMDGSAPSPAAPAGVEPGTATTRTRVVSAGGRARVRHSAPQLSAQTLQLLMGALPVPGASKQEAAPGAAAAAAPVPSSSAPRGPTVSGVTQLDSASEDDMDHSMWRAFASDDFQPIRINDDGTVDLDSVAAAAEAATAAGVRVDAAASLDGGAVVAIDTGDITAVAESTLPGAHEPSATALAAQGSGSGGGGGGGGRSSGSQAGARVSVGASAGAGVGAGGRLSYHGSVDDAVGDDGVLMNVASVWSEDRARAVAAALRGTAAPASASSRSRSSGRAAPPSQTLGSAAKSAANAAGSGDGGGIGQGGRDASSGYGGTSVAAWSPAAAQSSAGAAAATGPAAGATAGSSAAAPTSPTAASATATTGSAPRPGAFPQQQLPASSLSSVGLSSSDSTGAFTLLQYLVPMEYLMVDNRAERVLLCGWGETRFMTTLLRELDHGTSALPKGSEVLLLNDHDPASTLDEALKMVTISNIKVTHLLADPLQRAQMAARVDVTTIKAALVLCDERWVDPDENANNGVDRLVQVDMLRLDAMVMMVQLNIRKLLEDCGRPTINIVCQKVASIGMTRFEDRRRLPLGISVNFASFAAKLLVLSAVNPANLSAFAAFGSPVDLVVSDASELAGVGERLSFLQLQRRAQMQRKILVGYYLLPTSVDEPLTTVINPRGLVARTALRVWNRGNCLTKFLMLHKKDAAAPKAAASSGSAAASAAAAAGVPPAAPRAPGPVPVGGGVAASMLEGGLKEVLAAPVSAVASKATAAVASVGAVAAAAAATAAASAATTLAGAAGALNAAAAEVGSAGGSDTSGFESDRVQVAAAATAAGAAKGSGPATGVPGNGQVAPAALGVPTIAAAASAAAAAVAAVAGSVAADAQALAQGAAAMPPASSEEDEATDFGEPRQPAIWVSAREGIVTPVCVMAGADTPEAQEAEAQHRAMMAALEATGNREAAAEAAPGKAAAAAAAAVANFAAAPLPVAAAAGGLLGDEEGPGEWVVTETGSVYVSSGTAGRVNTGAGEAGGKAAKAAAAVMDLGGAMASAAAAAANAVSSTLHGHGGNGGGAKATDDPQGAGEGRGSHSPGTKGADVSGGPGGAGGQ